MNKNRNCVMITIGIWFLLLFPLFVSYAQIPVYTWRDHLSYANSKGIAFLGDKIYVATDNGIVITDKYFGYVKKISKVTGLSDVDVSTIGYSPRAVIIGYEDGNIDIIYKDGSIYNIPDIKLRQMYGSKRINKIYTAGNIAYLGCGFGVVKLDVEKRIVLETYYMGDNASFLDVRDVVLHNDTLFVATSKGIFIGDTRQNLLDYRQWKRLSYNFPYSQKFKSLDVKYNKVYAATDKIDVFNNYNLLCKFSLDSSFVIYDTVKYHNIYGFVSGISNVGVIHDTLVTFLDSLDNEDLYWSYEGENYNRGISSNFMEYHDGYFWFNDKWCFLVRTNREKHTYKILWMSTPDFNAAFDLKVYDDKMFVTKGGYQPSTLNKWNTFAYYVRDSIDIFNKKLWEYYDAICVVYDPNDLSHYFIGSWNAGLFEFKNNSLVKIYNKDNSSLSVANSTDYVRIPDMTYDSDGNLWILNFQTDNSLTVYTKDGTWKNFNVGIEGSEPEKILVAQDGKIWMVQARYKGIVVYDPGDDILDETDDRSKKLTIKDELGNVLNMNVISIAQDLDGVIWVGTTEGVLTFYNPEGVFDDPNFHAERIILEIGDGIGQYLMKYETVTSIAIDGANRKWFGTSSSGVYLMNSSCTRELLHFTTENSPLVSNRIQKVVIDQKTGEVYFSTDKGIVSFRSDATEAKPYFDKPYVYPNPVRPDYTGYITLTGLVQDADVKITDIAGNIVYQTKARGGTAVWNGKNFSGDRVHSGIYLALCSDDAGKVTAVLKILVLH